MGKGKSLSLSMTKVYSMAEVRSHTSETDCWVVVHNKVYDVTSFLANHPGGSAIILAVAGRDATNAFEDVGHSFFARKKLEDFFIGNLKEEDHIVYQNQYTKGRFENMEIQISIAIGVGLCAGLAYLLYRKYRK